MRPRTVVFLLPALACSGGEPAPTEIKPEFNSSCTPPIRPAVTASPTSVTKAPNTAGSATFFVTNNCTVTMTGMTFTSSRTGAVTSVGTPNPDTWATLAPGAGAKVTVSYNVGSSGSGTVVLTVTMPTDAINTGSQAVTVSQAGTGIPFGLWGLVVGPTVTPGPWTGGTGCCKDPAQTLKQLADAKARGIKMWFSPVGHDDASNPSTGDFDVTVWKQQFDKHQSNYAVYNQQYVPGGTFQGMILLDDITRTGWSVSFNDIETIAAYAEARIHAPTAVRQHAASLPAGTYVNLDIAWNQYSWRHGDVTAYRTAQTDAARIKSLGVLFGLNILNGGIRKDRRAANDPCWPGTGDPNDPKGECNMSPAELRSYGSVLGASPETCGFMMWKNDATYLARPGVMTAMNELATQMRNHPATSCVH